MKKTVYKNLSKLEPKDQSIMQGRLQHGVKMWPSNYISILVGKATELFGNEFIFAKNINLTTSD